MHPLIPRAVARRINFRRVQQGEEPRCIALQRVPAHQHQVEPMPGSARHHAVKHALLPRMQPRKRRPRLPQILLVVRMGILREVRFQPVVPLFRQKNIRRIKQGQQLRARQNALLRAACPAEGEVPPIMAQAVPVRINIVRHPVQHRQFAVAAVLRADIFARIVAHQPQRRMNRRARLNWRIQRICRQRVLFVQRHGKKDARLLHASPPFLRCIVPCSLPSVNSECGRKL